MAWLIGQEIVEKYCPPAARSWWDSVVPSMQSLSIRSNLITAYTKAARMVGRAPLQLDRDDVRALSEAGFPPFQGHALSELARMVLLLGSVERLIPEQHIEMIDDLYVRGDNDERVALLRTLSLLPEPARFLSTAVEACRTNVLPVFEAIACENPYPHSYFPELNFNQMVMKALFTGVPLPRIVGLSMRLTPALARMAQDYVRERTMAGRTVPDDIGLIVAEADVR